MAALTVETFGYELARIAADACSGRPPYGALLDALRSLMAADAAIAVGRDPVGGTLSVLGMHGYDEKALNLMTSPRLLGRDPAMRSIDRDRTRPALRWWHDPDYVYETSDSARGYLMPAGFNGGLSLRCFTDRGDHVGDVHMSTLGVLEPSPRQVDALAGCLPSVASLFARIPSPRPDEMARVEGGRVVHRSGLLLSEELDALRRIVERAGAGTPRWWSFRHRDGNGVWHRIDVVTGASGQGFTVHRDQVPHGLSARELAVLDCLCDGMTNIEAAQRLVLSERTVAHHVERILGKLGMRSRTAAVAAAIHGGLRLSPPSTRH